MEWNIAGYFHFTIFVGNHTADSSVEDFKNDFHQRNYVKIIIQDWSIFETVDYFDVIFMLKSGIFISISFFDRNL